MAEFSGLAAATLSPGDELRRGDAWWTVQKATVEPRRLGGPVVVLRCLDHHQEVREFSLSSDQAVTYRRPDVQPQAAHP